MSQPASQADPLLSHVTPLDSLGPLDEVSPVVPNLFTVSGVPMTFYVAPCTKRTHIQNLILVSGICCSFLFFSLSLDSQMEVS